MTEKPERTPQDAIAEMTDKYGIRPWVNVETHTSFEEITARSQTAITFVDQTIEFAEPEFLAGNHTAVTASLIEARSWMESLDSMTPEYLFYDDDEEASDLRQAKDRLNSAIVRYASSIAAQEKPQRHQMIQIWRELAAAYAFSAILSQHTSMLQADVADERQTDGHNLAATAIASTALDLVQSLHNIPNTSAAIRKTTRPHIQRGINALTEALRQFDDSRQIREQRAPIRLHQNIYSPGQPRLKATELGTELRSQQQDFLISLDIRNPRDTLIAYRNSGIIAVKRIIDHYDEFDSSDLATTHATALLHTIDLVELQEGSAADTLQRLAELLYSNAVAELHNVDHTEFSNFVEALFEANEDPQAVREAALEAIFPGHSGVEILFLDSPTNNPLVSVEQAKIITDAAQQAGVTPGVMRAICAAMQMDYQGLEIPAPTATAEQITFALDMCPFPLHIRQAMAIARQLGMTASFPEVITWTNMNCSDSEYHLDEVVEDDVE